MHLTVPPSHDPVCATSSNAKLAVGFASTREEVREVQRLRYEVFSKTFNASTLVNPEALNVDGYDDYCDHLVVRDTATSRIVGTYRMMGPKAAQRMGHYYAEKEFDLSRLASLRPCLVEAGHACVHPDYRSGSVIMMLWSALALYMQRTGCEYLMGCVSVSVSDGGHTAASLYHAFTSDNFAPAQYRVSPYKPFPVHAREAGAAVRTPPLLKGYLRSGGWVCGEPALDLEFNSADFFMLLPLSNLDRRYARHYLKTDTS